ncbi:MAG: DUF3710 domain-containing protein [Georgenia sp.]
MSLFRRRKTADTADPAAAPTDAVDSEQGDDETGHGADQRDADETGQAAGRGPFDVDDVPDLGARVDLGAVRVPARAGMQLRLEVEKKSQQIVAVTLGFEGSAMQLQVFAAPRTVGIWEELREEISASVAKQGGTSERTEGPFGPELVTRLPVKGVDGTTGLRPARFIGVDGARWFLRGVVTGKAAVDGTAAAALEEVFADVVVVRGSEARAPRDVLMLQAPGRPKAADTAGDETPSLDLMRRGPEITEVR